MKRARVLAAVIAGAMATIGLVATTADAQASTIKLPGKITAVSAKAGPGVGEVTFTWTGSGKYVSYWGVETALSSFKRDDSRLPTHGRNHHYWHASPSARTLTLSAAQVAEAGASADSGNHLYYRFYSVHKTKKGKAVRRWPYLQSVAVQPATTDTDGNTVRVASFNVRTARATDDTHDWLARVPLVAQQISDENPGVVLLQELGPGRADGVKGTTDGHTRQTDSLVNELADGGEGKYKLVRDNSYISPDKTEGSQGTRILYDSSRYSLVTDCPSTTNGRNYSSSCSIALPIRSSDSDSIRRRSAYAEFQSLSTGQYFYVASVHLDERHSSSMTTEHSYEDLRADQMSTVLDKLDSVNTHNYPEILAGDLNSWQNNQGGDKAHDTLIKAGFWDTAAATDQVHETYTTYNDFAKTMPTSPSGWGARLDVIAGKGILGATKFENVFEKTNTDRPSDHNMIYADVVLPS